MVQVVNIGGILPMASLSALDDLKRREAETANAQSVVQGLAQYVRECFDNARRAKETTVEPRMLASIRARRGEYEPEVLAEIRKMGGSEIYMMLTSNKCRAAAGWLRDVLLGAGDDKPWSIVPTAVSELSPEDMRAAVAQAVEEAIQLERATGSPLPAQNVRSLALAVKDDVLLKVQETARRTAERMERKMEDQLKEGGFLTALNAFIDDLVTFPAAILKGPVVRKRRRLAWKQAPEGGFAPQVVDDLVLEWERVDPFMAYPAPHASNIDDGYFIERHKLTRQAINELLGVPGYDEGALRAVLEEYGRGGLNDWLSVDTTKAIAEGKETSVLNVAPEPTIDALQYWGSVPGKYLIEWGIDEKDTIDPAQEYSCEVWLIGRWVVKAVLNPDPLGRKPYYKASFEEIPGVFWGNSVADLVRDCQSMCNAAARSLANNMGIASGPQVWVNNERLADGEEITQIYPWKIWQTKGDPYGTNSAPPVDFFQPSSNAAELMAIYEKFALIADENSGIPRYMAGSPHVGGAGRTASGMSMLITNAGKSIKQVLANIDNGVLVPLIERLYQHNMMYGTDPDLKGDVRVVARGAASLMVKENAQLRRNEFLQIALSSPIVGQIVGEEAIAELLRESAKSLDMNVNKIVPSPEKLRARQAILAQQAVAQQQAAVRGPIAPSGQALMDGAPVVDNFGPRRG